MSSSIDVDLEIMAGDEDGAAEVVEPEVVVEGEVVVVGVLVVVAVDHSPNICLIHNRNVAHSSLSPMITPRVIAIMKYQPVSSEEAVELEVEVAEAQVISSAMQIKRCL